MRGRHEATTDVLIVTPSPTPLLSPSLSPSFVYLTDPLWNVPEPPPPMPRNYYDGWEGAVAPSRESLAKHFTPTLTLKQVREGIEKAEKAESGKEVLLKPLLR